MAGQIGLIPGSMALGGSGQQAELALTHVVSVLEACHTHLNSALLGMCYYTGEGAGWRARMAWRKVCTTGFSHSEVGRSLSAAAEVVVTELHASIPSKWVPGIQLNFFCNNYMLAMQ